MGRVPADLVTLPKVDLHVHLESTVRGSAPAEIRGFLDFFDKNQVVRDSLRTPADFRRVAYEMCAGLAADGVRYVEVSFSAAAHGERLGAPEMPLVSVLEGLTAGGAEFGVRWRVLLDTSRRRPVARAAATVALARRFAGVVAVGLAGDEAYPAAPFAAVFADARAAGLHVGHHAGEAAGPASIREALAGGSERLGHGIRILDDPSLVAEVRERRIPLEVCPSSNVALGFAPSFAAHPLPRLRDAGLVVTLNTDIPAMVGTTLTAEYARARDAFGWSDAELAAIAVAGVDASFAPDPLKATLRADIAAWLARLSPDLGTDPSL
jgi:adenosine deaminase